MIEPTTFREGKSWPIIAMHCATHPFNLNSILVMRFDEEPMNCMCNGDKQTAARLTTGYELRVNYVRMATKHNRLLIPHRLEQHSLATTLRSSHSNHPGP